MSKAKTVRSEKIGKCELRLVEQSGVFFGLADGKICAQGPDKDDVWQTLHNEAGKSDPRYFGFKGARSRFLKFFPNGFNSDGYREQERDYKIAAKSKLDREAPLDLAVNGSGYGEALLSAYGATNMLSRFEKTKVQAAFRGEQADAIVRGLARFTLTPDKASLALLENLLKPYDSAKWTVVTYLPYLWSPERHMFLKPEATKDFATRVGHPFAATYEARLNLVVYEALIDLAEQTSTELADLAPEDRIDIQSFIWIVGNYDENRDDVYP